MCMCIYIIVSKRIVIEGGYWGPPPELFLVIFIQNGAILGNSNGYTCLDIMPQQEGWLPIYLIRDVQYLRNNIYNLFLYRGIKVKPIYKLYNTPSRIIQCL